VELGPAMEEILVILLLLVLSGFFASAEVAFFGLNTFLLEREKGPLVRLIKRLLSQPVDLIISILIGNELVNILISSLGTKFLKETVGDAGVAFGTVIFSLLIFYFGEVIPKNVALQLPEKLAKIYALPIYIFNQLLFPIRFLIKKLFGGLIEKIEGKQEQFLTKEELLYHLTEGYKKGEITKEELEMVKRVLEMDETSVEEIMTPRTDIFALEETKKVKEVIDPIVEKAHSKIPLFRENLDNTTGLLYTKHLLPTEDNLEKPLKEFKREVAFIPQTLNLEDLLEEFKQKRTQLFMVVDEHGGTSGLVTYSDFLSWLLGEMVEEWSPESDIKAVGKNIYLIDASVNIEVLAQKFGLKLPEDYEYSTLGGYLMDQFKGIPSRGDVFETGHLKFVVEEMENNRIKRVKLVVRN
jgi:CBS domain containing-hemolysin-like protein